jgi:hypothetical protein
LVHNGKGTVHYWLWHSIVVPVPVLAFWYFGSVSALARVITGTGIKKSSTNKRNLHVFCFVPTTIPLLEDYNTKTTNCNLIVNCNQTITPQTHHELFAPIIVLPFGGVMVTGIGTDSA